jgi:hypothetical protein
MKIIKLYFTIYICLITTNIISSQNVNSNIKHSSYTLGCPVETQMKHLNWVKDEAKRFKVEKLPKVRTDAELYKIMKNEEFLDSFFTSPSVLSNKHYILRYLPTNLMKEHIDCRILNFKVAVEMGTWRKEVIKVTTVKEFLDLLKNCPINSLAWASKYMDKYNITYNDLVSDIRSKKITLFRFEGSNSPIILPQNKAPDNDKRFKALN